MPSRFKRFWQKESHTKVRNTPHQLQARAFLLWEQAKAQTKAMRYEAAADLRSQAFEMALMAEENCAPNSVFIKRPDVQAFYGVIKEVAIATKDMKSKYCRTRA